MTDTLITNATLITMDKDRRVLGGAALAIEGGKISWIGASDDAAWLEANETIDANSGVITPGFVNAHVHTTGDPLTRHYMPDDLNDDDRLFTWVMPRYFAHTPEDERLSALFCGLELLKGGTTTFLEAGTIRHLDHAAQGFIDVGIRGCIGAWVEGRAFDPKDDETKLIDQAIATMEAGVRAFPKGEGLLTGWPILVGHNTNPDAVWQAAKSIADAAGVGIAAHMSPYNADPQWYLEHTGKRPMVHLESLGVMDERTVITHATHLDDAEIEVFVSAGSHVAYCPFATLKGAFDVSKAGRYTALFSKGVNMAFATDGYDTEILQAARIGAGTVKDLAGDVGAFGALQALEAITINGAKALGMEDEIGSLEVGKQADLVLFDTNTVQWRPLLSPLDQLIWSADGRSIDSVWVAGRQLIRSGQAVHLDEAQLLRDVQTAAEGVIKRSGLPFERRWPVAKA